MALVKTTYDRQTKRFIFYIPIYSVCIITINLNTHTKDGADNKSRDAVEGVRRGGGGAIAPSALVIKGKHVHFDV